MLDLDYFYLLKKELLVKYQEMYPNWKRSIHDFRGREISNFQRLLEEKVNSRISEKWFYTHIKPNENLKLPRVDMLDLLCHFLDFSDWEDFKNHQQKIIEKEAKETEDNIPQKSLFPFPKLKFLALAILGLIFLWSSFLKKYNTGYAFYFMDADTKEMIKNKDIEIEIFQPNESPIFQKTDKNGCFKFIGKNEKITFVIKAPYYKSDTITRIIKNKNRKEIIDLKRDDYALMIHIFSNSKINDWEKRRNELDEMIAADAMIFQVENNNQTIGLDILNKEEFIDRMTLPINSLKNIRIIQTQYRKEKIYRLRFILEE